MGEKVELGKRNWQFIAREGSVAIVNRIDNIGLVAKVRKMKEPSGYQDAE